MTSRRCPRPNPRRCVTTPRPIAAALRTRTRPASTPRLALAAVRPSAGKVQWCPACTAQAGHRKGDTMKILYPCQYPGCIARYDETLVGTTDSGPGVLNGWLYPHDAETTEDN